MSMSSLPNKHDLLGPHKSEDSILFMDDARHGSIVHLPGDRSRTLERKKTIVIVDDDIDDEF